MNKPTHLTPDQRAELVAYLDGELEESATQAMERVLAEDADARHDVDMLARTFSLLDSLPRPNASSEFAEKTLTSLKVETAKEPWRELAWYRHARRGIVVASWLVALLISVTTAYYTAHRAVPHEDRRLIQELPVIEKLDEYSDIGGIEELREMAEHGVFDEDEVKTQR